MLVDRDRTCTVHHQRNAEEYLVANNPDTLTGARAVCLE